MSVITPSPGGILITSREPRRHLSGRMPSAIETNPVLLDDIELREIIIMLCKTRMPFVQECIDASR